MINKSLFEATCQITDLARTAQALRIDDAIKQGYHQQMNTIQFWEYFATLRLDFGRQSGKSSYIAKHAQPGDIVLVESASLKDNMKRSLACNMNDDVHVACAVGFAAGIRTQGTIPQGATIWIDDANWTFQVSGGIRFRDILCEVAVRSNAYTPGVGSDIRFVCLG